MYVHVIHFICHYIFSSLLAERKEYARQSRASEEVMRDRVMEIKEVVEEEKVSKREITTGECGSPSFQPVENATCTGVLSIIKFSIILAHTSLD